MERSKNPRVLLVFPRFAPDSFWSCQATCEALGRRYTAAPLGMITVAALLPPEWPVRLVDRNVEELSDAELDWAELVMTGGMLTQQTDTLALIARAHARGKPIVVGGPDATCNPHRYVEADFRILGEAEEPIRSLIEAWRSGLSRATFEAIRLPDLSLSPTPRFDLLRLDRYMRVSVQLTRGGSDGREHGNVVRLSRRSPRVKSPEQVIGELDALLAAGHRGHVDLVHDGLVGNRKAIKPLLEQLVAWGLERGHPFEFSTEASLDLAEDEELLALMKQAGFFACFVGLGTPDPTERQGLRRDLAESVRRLHGAGLMVSAGFVIGFGAEQGSVADTMVDLLEEASIPVCTVGLLYALPNTWLASRLREEGRLQVSYDRPDADDADEGSSGIDFATRRPRAQMLADYRAVLERLYAPEAFFERTRRMARALDMRGHPLRPSLPKLIQELHLFARISELILRSPENRGPYLDALLDVLLNNPRAVKAAVSMAALYLHHGPFAARLLKRIDARLANEAEGEQDAVPPPSLVRTESVGAEAW